MKILVTVTRTIEVEVTDDFPIAAAYIQRILDWKMNESCDGRHRFSTELAIEGIDRAVRNGIDEAVSQDIFQKMGNPRTKKGFKRRDRAEAEALKKILSVRGVQDEGPLRITVKENNT